MFDRFAPKWDLLIAENHLTLRDRESGDHVIREAIHRFSTPDTLVSVGEMFEEEFRQCVLQLLPDRQHAPLWAKLLLPGGKLPLFPSVYVSTLVGCPEKGQREMMKQALLDGGASNVVFVGQPDV